VRNGIVQGLLWVSGTDCVVEDVLVVGEVRMDGTGIHLRRLTVEGNVTATNAQASSLSDVRVRTPMGGWPAINVDSCFRLVLDRVQVLSDSEPLRIEFSEYVEVRGAILESDNFDVEIFGGRWNQIRDSRTVAVKLWNTQEVLLAGNHLGNPFSSSGIQVDGSSQKAVIRDNTIAACNIALSIWGSAIARDNVIEGYDYQGIEVQGSRCVIEGNTLRGSAGSLAGIVVEGSENVLRRNTVHHVPGGEGIAIQGQGNLVLDNSITTSGGAGLHFYPVSSGNVYRGNTVASNWGPEIQDDNPGGNEPPAGGFTIDPLGNVTAF
jgi:hypothetical protein